MQRFEKMHRAERYGEVLGNAIVDQDGTDQRRLGLDIVRQFAHFAGRIPAHRIGIALRGETDDFGDGGAHGDLIARIALGVQGRCTACGAIVDNYAPLLHASWRGIALT